MLIKMMDCRDNSKLCLCRCDECGHVDEYRKEYISISRCKNHKHIYRKDGSEQILDDEMSVSAYRLWRNIVDRGCDEPLWLKPYTGVSHFYDWLCENQWQDGDRIIRVDSSLLYNADNIRVKKKSPSGGF